jgi:ADP-ribosylglycohydrolase
MRESVVDAILGCIVGGAIGDAAGAAFEGGTGSANPSSLSASLSLLEADWRLTDDTQLTLATCEALLEGEPDAESIAASLLCWWRARRVTNVGASTLKALRDLEAGAHWALAGRKGERAAGNGAAMRIAPLAFCLKPRDDNARRLIRDVCRITHHSDEAYVGALAVVLAIHAATGGGQSLEEIASHLPDTSVRDRLLAYVALPPGTTVTEAARLHGASGYVIESVPLALFAAQQVTELGFAGMLEQVIATGGDTDSNAALAGQVAGTAMGFARLPAGLLERLPDADLVLGIARKFAGSVAERTT